MEEIQSLSVAQQIGLVVFILGILFFVVRILHNYFNKEAEKDYARLEKEREEDKEQCEKRINELKEEVKEKERIINDLRKNV